MNQKALINALVVLVVVLIAGVVYFAFFNKPVASPGEPQPTAIHSPTPVVSPTPQITQKVTPSPSPQQITPLITVLSPNGKENWQTGETHSVKWKSSGLDSKTVVTIELGVASESPSETWLSTTRTIGYANILDGSFTWTIPRDIPVAFNYKIRVLTPGGIKDVTDGYVSIVAEGTKRCTDFTPMKLNQNSLIAYGNLTAPQKIFEGILRENPIPTAGIGSTLQRSFPYSLEGRAINVREDLSKYANAYVVLTGKNDVFELEGIQRDEIWPISIVCK